MQVLAIFELVVHREEMDELYITQREHEKWNYRILDEKWQNQVVEVIEDQVIPFIEKSHDNALWKGDGIYLERIGMKAIFTAMIHLSKEQRAAIEELCQCHLQGNVEFNKWSDFIHSFYCVC